MLPLRDLNPTRRLPIATYGLLVLNVLVFLWQLMHSDSELQSIFMRLSVVPAQVTAAPLALDTFLDFLRSMFFHGGWVHLLSNMLYLWLFADNIEDRMGIPLFLLLYFVGGIVAASAQVLMSPGSMIPLVGASGAIAAVLGSYMVFFPSVRVSGIIPLGFWARRVTWPAWIVLGMWFVTQLFYGALSIGVESGSSGGVAFFAHIGGFVAGLVMTWIFLMLFPQAPREDRERVIYERAGRYRY
jgi:membrane associated rhomboid family serine protease